MMMVNQLNNNQVPWPSTIPDQMPWLAPSAGLPVAPMQFVGEQAYGPEQAINPDHMAVFESQPQLLDVATTVKPAAATISPSVGVQTRIPFSDTLFQNPFYHQQHSGGRQLAQVGPIMGQSIDPQIPFGAALPEASLAAMGAIFGSTLTPIPSQTATASSNSFEPIYQASNHKRSSFEMEDELTTKEAPPTKQQLSETKLFQRFGSLHLSGETGLSTEEIGCDATELDVDEDEPSTSAKDQIALGTDDRKEFDRYVYLLFKDKKSDGQFPIATSNAVERIIREDREKLSKAVILWNPPPRPAFVNDSDGSDDDNGEPKYKDHRDFLKDPANNSSVIITEVSGEDVPIEGVDEDEVVPGSSAPDYIMLE